MLKTLNKAPFPYFGGKTDAAPAVWNALGDVRHYVEPFCGSLAVLLNRPHPCNRTYFSETVNDVDGALINVWRSIQYSPEATAHYCSWPVTEADLTARHLWLLKWKQDRELERLMADPEWHDPKAAGYWLYGICCWIGGGWCDGKGPWIVGADGRITKRNNDKSGVSMQKPRVSESGMGIHKATLREPGIQQRRPYLTTTGRGIYQSQLYAPGVGDSDATPSGLHPMTMPELLRWFGFLSARLRHVRILNGDWSRCVTVGALKMLEIRIRNGKAGVFLDPPYSADADRDNGLYAYEDAAVAHAVRQWCLENGDNPDYRIVLAGFEGEHNELESRGWRVEEWFKKGFLKGGMGNLGKSTSHQQHRERLWCSPHCLSPATDRQFAMTL